MCLVRLILAIQLHNHYFASVFRFFDTRQSVTGRLIHVCLICLEFNCEQFTVEVYTSWSQHTTFCLTVKWISIPVQYNSSLMMMKNESVFNSLLVDNYLITFFLDMCLSEPCLFLSLSCYKLLVFYITCITVHLVKPGSPRQWEPFRWQNWNNRYPVQNNEIYTCSLRFLPNCTK